MSGVSQKTALVATGGLLAVVVMAALITFGVGGEDVTIAIADFGETFVVAFAAALVIKTALSFGAGEALRRQWMLIGIGVACFAIGDAVWSWMEVVQQAEVPYPGLPDVFYALQYPFLASGLIIAGLAYRGLVPVKGAFIRAAAVGVALLAAVAVFLLPQLSGPDVPVAEQAISIFYPVADIVFCVVPALMLIFVVAQLGGGRLARPWWAVTVGVGLMTLSDSLYSWLEAFGRYNSGSVIDYGWSLGAVAIAVGASLAADLAQPARLAAPVPAQEAA